MGRKPVRKWMTGFGAIVMALSLAGCGSQESGNTAMPSVPPSLENVTETKPVTEDGISGGTVCRWLCFLFWRKMISVAKRWCCSVPTERVDWHPV